eukprot:SAG31_NODE_17798_length_657_cov_1.168459_1_plen_124_part_10
MFSSSAIFLLTMSLCATSSSSSEGDDSTRGLATAVWHVAEPRRLAGGGFRSAAAAINGALRAASEAVRAGRAPRAEVRLSAGRYELHTVRCLSRTQLILGLQLPCLRGFQSFRCRCFEIRDGAG